MDNEELLKQLGEKIICGEELMQNVSKNKGVDGIDKLKKKIKQERNFILKIVNSKEAKKEHLLCTNLQHFEALVLCLQSSCNPVAVLQYFGLSKADGSFKRICVDIVAENGKHWIKVIARNPRAISQLYSGAGEFGQRSIIDHAVEYLECAQQHPHFFIPPKIIFEFACGIERTVADHLEALGITVNGERLKMQDSPKLQTHVVCDKERHTNEGIFLLDYDKSVQKLNLDVTAMLAYISNLTNGNCHFEFKEPILTQQAQWERARPVKPVLDHLFEGKTLICCESALTDFKSIVSTLGGPGERKRANELLSRVSITPDLSSLRAQFSLKLGGKIKPRSLAIFSTGDALKAITVTANEGFVRASKNQGVEFAVFVHESRALTEGKETDAKSIHGD